MAFVHANLYTCFIRRCRQNFAGDRPAVIQLKGFRANHPGEQAAEAQTQENVTKLMHGILVTDALCQWN